MEKQLENGKQLEQMTLEALCFRHPKDGTNSFDLVAQDKVKCLHLKESLENLSNEN